MMKRLYYILICLAFVAGVASCQRDEELPVGDDGVVERTEDLPIQIVATIGNAATRTVEHAKKEFTATYNDPEDPEKNTLGDVIHVESTFKLKLDNNGVISYEYERRYCALQLNENNQWVSLGPQSFAWPTQAVSARFRAFYVNFNVGKNTNSPGQTGPLTGNVGGSSDSSGSGSDGTPGTDSEPTEKDHEADAILFTDLSDGTDPLYAEIENDVLYGHTVVLDFKHLLTHLTIIELAAGIDDKLSFRVNDNDNETVTPDEPTPDPEDPGKEPGEGDDDENNDNNGGEDGGNNNGDIIPEGQQTRSGVTRAAYVKEGEKNNFNNAFNIWVENVTDDQGVNGPKIMLGYYSIASGDNLALIKSQTELVRDKDTRQESRQVGFFLQPGREYNAFSVYYSNGSRYLSYKNSDPNATADPTDHALLSNNRYIFNVKKSAGVTISTPPEEQWDENPEFIEVVDAEGFLRAVNSNEEFTQLDENGKELIILEKVLNPAGTLLKYNIKFQTPYYHIFSHPDEKDENGNQPDDFEPSVGGDNIFDGGYHYIMDLHCPLFFQNHGIIKNVGFKNVSIGGPDLSTEQTPNVEHKYGMWESNKNYKEEGYQKAYEYNRTGVIATRNYGTVQNIRIKDVSVNVGINATESNQEAHNVGALFGVNDGSGFVDEVYLSGKISVTVQNYPNPTINAIPEVNIGGLAGQNLGTMTNIVQLVDNRSSLKEDDKPRPVEIVVTNLLDGPSGAYYIGGIVGTNTGKLSDVSIPTRPEADGKPVAVTVNSSNSRGVLSDIGGIVGKADSSQGNEISSCMIASGSVEAGITAKFEQIDPFSYTGGIVGMLSERTDVFNCTTFCSVIGAGDNKVGEGVTCAAGGAFGNLQQNAQKGKLMSIAAFGDQLEGKNAGCFAGDVATGRKWFGDYENVADVKDSFTPTLPYIAIPKEEKSTTDPAPDPQP